MLLDDKAILEMHKYVADTENVSALEMKLTDDVKGMVVYLQKCGFNTDVQCGGGCNRVYFYRKERNER